MKDLQASPRESSYDGQRCHESREIVCATTNVHKLRECQAYLEPMGIGVKPPPTSWPEPIEETGVTFAENATLKARAWFERLHQPILADDSGLVVPALLGSPGVYSARYRQHEREKRNMLGQTFVEASMQEPINPDPLSFVTDVDYLLYTMRSLTPEQRMAYLICSVAYISPKVGLRCFTGICLGRIVEQKRGAHGFGYDVVFVPQHGDQTFAEVPQILKEQISHRTQALRAWLVWMQRYVWGNLPKPTKSDMSQPSTAINGS